MKNYRSNKTNFFDRIGALISVYMETLTAPQM